MLVGTPPSLTNEQFSLENPLTPGTASATPGPIEHTIDYECCVCRLMKSDSESPIGLIGSSCISLCKKEFSSNERLREIFL